MTRFLDGPASGVSLMLHRAPMFLRAVRSTAGEWDALDQLADTPASGESVVVYRMASGPTRMHLQQRVKGRRVCGWYEGGEYRVVDPQPDDATLRETARWRGWCSAQVGRPLASDGTAAEAQT